MVFYCFQLCAWVGDAIFFKKKHTSGFYANLCKKLKIQKPKEWSNNKKRALVVLPVSRTVYQIYSDRTYPHGALPIFLFHTKPCNFRSGNIFWGGFCLIILTIVALG